MSPLARLRKSAGYTQETFATAFAEMARQLDIDATLSVRQLRRWESPGPPLPHPGQQAVLEALLGVPLGELGFCVPPGRVRGLPSGVQYEDVYRRRFVVDVGALMGAAVISPRPSGRRIGASDVAAFQREMSGLYAIDHGRGGKFARKEAMRLLGGVEEALGAGAYLERVGRDLHALVGTLHAHLGWLEFDAGRPTQARTAAAEALTSAHLVGDPLLEIRALASLSLLAVERERPWEAVAAASRASQLAQAYGSPKVKLVLAIRQARALSSAGDLAAARRALSQALTWHDRSDSDTDAPGWTTFAGQVEVDYATAAWHVQSGHPAHAVPFLRAAVNRLGPMYSRNTALYRARLAEVLMKTGEVEEACAEAVASAGAAQGMTSVRLTRRLRTVARAAAGVDAAVARDAVEHLRVLGVSVQGDAA